jgi:hypothetical protein
VSEIHAILTETLREHAPSYSTVKNWVAKFKRGNFSNFFLNSGWAKDLSAPWYEDSIGGHDMCMRKKRGSKKGAVI